MIALYTSQEIKSFRTQAIVTGKLLHSWFWLHLWQKDPCTVPWLRAACVGVWLRPAWLVGHWAPFWCYVSFCWRVLKERSCLSNQDHNRSTSVHVSGRDSCPEWFAALPLVSIPGGRRKMQTVRDKEGKTQRVQRHLLLRAETAFTQILFLSL